MVEFLYKVTVWIGNRITVATVIGTKGRFLLVEEIAEGQAVRGGMT
jgi:hypothetical protein